MNELSNLKPAAGATTSRRRKGRGRASGNGKTCGKGQKGQKSRSGGKPPVGFEGGQMPLHRRLPKRGFSNYGHMLDYTAVNVSELNRFEAGDTVDIEALKRAGLAKGHDARVKITGTGDLTTNVVVQASRIAEKGVRPKRSKFERRSEYVVVSKSAAEKIAAAGGEVRVG